MKKIILTVTGVLLILFVIIFSLQNDTTVIVKILSKEFDASLAWVVFLTFIFGMLSGFLILLPKIISLNLKLRKANKKIKTFENNNLKPDNMNQPVKKVDG